MKSIANIIHYKYSHLEILDKNGNLSYYETTDGFWRKSEFNENSDIIYYEYSDGEIYDIRNEINCKHTP